MEVKSFIKIIIFIIILIKNTKHKYDSSYLDLVEGNSTVIWKLAGKSISTVFTLSFNFKISNLINNGYILSVGYFNIFFKALFIRQNQTNYEINLHENSENSENLFININNSYYGILECEKIDISGSNYRIRFKFIYGNQSKETLIEYTSDTTEFDFTKLLINLGSNNPKNQINMNIRLEELTIYNKKIDTNEKNEIIFGNVEPLLFIDFSNALAYSQYYYNKINNDFIGAINGEFIYNDKYDLFQEYIKISNTEIKKKLYLFNNQQYIFLSKEIIKYLGDFVNKNYLVYLKITMHLNDDDNIDDLDIIYKLYNRNNKSGIDLNLKKINESSTDLFEFNIKISNASNYHTIISNSQAFNFDYIILKYNLNNDLTLYNIELTFRFNGNEINLNQTLNSSIFSKDDNHYIGDYDGVLLTKGHILIELEEFMLGKGTFVKTISSDLVYDDIKLFCSNSAIINNKIKRTDLNNCILRNEITTITSNCEYEENSNCIFKTPDVNTGISITPANINCNWIIHINYEICIASYSNCTSNSDVYDNLCQQVCNGTTPINTTYCNFYCYTSGQRYSDCTTDLNSVLDTPNSTVETFINNHLNNNFKLNKPFRENFTDIKKLTTNYNVSGTNTITYSHNSNIELSYNFIFAIEFDNLNITNNIFQIYLQYYRDYSTIVINKNNPNKLFTFEWLLKGGYTKPSITIKNTTNSSQFRIKYMMKVHIDSSIITNNTNKFLGEPKNRYHKYKIIPLKPYVLIDNNFINYRIENDISAPCNSICDNCNGPTNKQCQNCKSLYMNYNNQGCLLKNANNCSTYNNNPSFCNTCNNNYHIINTNNYNVLCFCKNSCNCEPGYILYNDSNICELRVENICQKSYVLQPKNTVASVTVDKCLPCGNTCSECNISNINECLNCKYRYHLLGNSCISCNIDGKFIDKYDLDSNKQPKCNSCHTSCKRCISNSNLKCLSCYSGNFLQNISSDSNICTDCNNITGYYIDGFNCNMCYINCLNCINKSTNCTSCKDDYLLDILNKDCVLKCRNGTYQNGDSCLKCHEICKTCTGGDDKSCIECNSLYLHNTSNSCVECNNLNNLKIENKCYDCNNECRSCDGINNNNCLSCKNGLKLYEKYNICLNKCPSKTYSVSINNLSYCRNCYENCLTCINFKENSCLSCENNLIYNKYTNRCLESCEEGYYKLETKLCEKCPENCNSCNEEGICIKCKKGYFLYDDDNRCGLCNEGYYISGEECLKCHPNCLTCTDHNNCLSCKLMESIVYDKITDKQFCKKKCNDNKFFNKIDNKCLDCNKCNNCQIGNDLLCKKCLKCQTECIFNFKFNETGLYLFNEKKIFLINNTIIYNDNKGIINNNKELWGSDYFFEIINNNDDIKLLKLKFNNTSILKSVDCSKKINSELIIKKVYNKNCKIEKINYNNESYRLNITFNFDYLLQEISDNVYYKIINDKIKYKLDKENITKINEKSLSFIFKPNYFKSKFKADIIFNKNIIKSKNCIFNVDVNKNFQIDLKKKIKFDNDSEIKLKVISKVWKDDNKISETIQNLKPVINKTKQYSFGIVILSSIFSQFIGILIRFFQVVYILDFISILKIDLGIYTNSFLKYLDFDIKLFYELNDIIEVSKKDQDKIIQKALLINPKLKATKFAYLTYVNIEFILCFILTFIIFIFKIIDFCLNYFIKSKFKLINKNLRIKNNLNKKYEKKNDIIYKKLKNYEWLIIELTK